MDNLNLLFGLRATKTNSVPVDATSGIVVIYRSNPGMANKVAWRISEIFTDGDITLIDLKHQKSPELRPYKRIVIVGSVYLGKIQEEIETFCSLNEQQLLNKELCLYLWNMQKTEITAVQFQESYPEILRKHASSQVLMRHESHSSPKNSGKAFSNSTTVENGDFISLISRRPLSRFALELKN